MPKLINKALILFSIFTVSWSHADELLDTVSNKYQTTALVEAEITKEIKSEFIAMAETSEGKFFLSKGLFRLDLTKPTKSSLIYDGSYIWDVPADEKKVTRIKIDSKSGNKAFLSSLINKKDRDSAFKLKTSTPDKKKALVDYSFESKKKDSELTSFVMTLSKDEEEIKKIEYTDNVGNKTTFMFGKTKFLTKGKPALFKYKPGKTTQVNDL